MERNAVMTDWDLIAEIDGESEWLSHEVLCFHRWGDKEGGVCPRCGYEPCGQMRTRKRFRCRECRNEFTVTSGTIFAYRKLTSKQLLKLTLLADGADITDEELVEMIGVDRRHAASLRLLIQKIEDDDGAFFCWKRKE